MTRESLRKLRNRAVFLASLLALASLVYEYGFYLSPGEEHFIRVLNIVIVGLFLLDILLSFFSVHRLKTAVLRTLPPLIIAFVFGIQLIVVKFFLANEPQIAQPLMRFLRISSLSRFYFVILQGYMILSLIFYTQKFSRRIAYSKFHPAQLLVVAFVAMILFGSFLLMLPRATPPDARLSYVDALFTSTSAVCVTGLIVVDTSTAFTRFGQFVIMLLMQIGGLGIMTFAAFFAILSGRGLSIKERIMVGEVMQVDIMRRVSQIIVSILGVTLVIEGLGSVLFYRLLPQEGVPVATRAFVSIFHAVSGFCNAGFSTFSDSFMSFAGNAGLNLLMMILIVLGGLGFTVHHDLINAFWTKAKKKKPRKFMLQTKIVLVTSFSLLLLGTVAIYFFERGEVSFLQALFQSTTARTAGFNTIAQGEMHEESQFLTTILMFIGAAPGSTGGGIKVTTLVVFLATVAGMLRGRSMTEISRKTIPEETVREALVIFGLSLFAVIVSFMLLLLIEEQSFKTLLFETVSAFGTVGLSLGVTAKLSTAGKIVVLLTMLFGRIGPMTIALAVSGRVGEKVFSYPQEKVMVG